MRIADATIVFLLQRRVRETQRLPLLHQHSPRHNQLLPRWPKPNFPKRVRLISLERSILRTLSRQFVSQSRNIASLRIPHVQTRNINESTWYSAFATFIDLCFNIDTHSAANTSHGKGVLRLSEVRSTKVYSKMLVHKSLYCVLVFPFVAGRYRLLLQL